MCNCVPLLEAIERYLQKADDDLADTLGAEGYLLPELTVEDINAIEDELAEILEEQRSELLWQIEHHGIQAALDGVLPDFLADERVAALFAEKLESIMSELIDAYIKSIDKELVFNTFTDRTTDWIRSWSEELGQIMQLSSHDDMENILTSALEEGKSVADVTDQLMDSYTFSRKRARRTAITELLTAHSAAAHEAYRQSPAVEGKMWRHTGAHKNTPRLNHMAIDGQTVPKDKPFELIGADGSPHSPMYPRDPILPPAERVNCHCITQPVVDESILGMSLEERRRLQQEAIDADNGEWEKELDARNKARAGIDENTVTLDWFRQKDKAGQIKYIGGKAKWALHEAGLVTDDAMLKKIKTTTLKDLADDGIITVTATRVKHSALGEYKGPSQKYPNGRMIKGGHAQAAMDECDARGIEYSVSYTYANGVRVGSVPSSRSHIKRNGGQSWFPADWEEDDVWVAGTYVANSPGDVSALKTKDGAVSGHKVFQEYRGIRVGIIIDLNGQVTTIFPDVSQ